MQIDTFNRTIVELKLEFALGSVAVQASFNRTIVELKLATRIGMN